MIYESSRRSKHEYYTIDSDDEEEEIEFIKETRDKFIQKYDKRNNRQFKIKKILI